MAGNWGQDSSGGSNGKLAKIKIELAQPDPHSAQLAPPGTLPGSLGRTNAPHPWREEGCQMEGSRALETALASTGATLAFTGLATSGLGTRALLPGIPG